MINLFLHKQSMLPDARGIIYPWHCVWHWHRCELGCGCCHTNIRSYWAFDTCDACNFVPVLKKYYKHIYQFLYHVFPCVYPLRNYSFQDTRMILSQELLNTITSYLGPIYNKCFGFMQLLQSLFFVWRANGAPEIWLTEHEIPFGHAITTEQYRLCRRR